MASSLSFVEYACGQMAAAGEVAFRKMFGEYAVYCGGKLVALVCDNALYVKPTSAGRMYAGEVAEAAPYPGAKPYFLIDDRLEDRAWLAGLIVATASELPLPKPKRPGNWGASGGKRAS
ncbi:MAG: TfoX/Sxy family protein [Chlorobiaceae bacterium]|nr:TfoX/Sxy family protein [Chlorobiaceae bacterium]